MRILGISGSLRRGSHNRKLLRAAGALLPPGVELVEWDGLAGLPAFDEDLENTPPEVVREFFAAIEGADALLIATPEYNASLPGALKNAIDWASRPFPENVLRYKPTAVIGASTGPLRRRLGAGRGAQGAEGLRRARARVRAAGRHGRLRVRGGRDALADPELTAAPEGPPRRPRARGHSARRGVMIELPLIEPEPAHASGRTRRATAQRILAAAGELVAEQGIEAVSMEDVARAACVGTGTLYRRFGDRAGLAFALLDEQTRDFQNALISGPPPLGPGAPARERLQAFGAGYLDLLETPLGADGRRRAERQGRPTGRTRCTRRTSRSCCARPRRSSTRAFTAEALLATLAPGAPPAHARTGSAGRCEQMRDGWDALVDALSRRGALKPITIRASPETAHSV